MYFIASLVRDTIPSYFEKVPIPRTLGGFLDLSGKDWLHLIVFTGSVGALGYYATKPYIEEYKKRKSDPEKRESGMVNHMIQKECKKVVDVIDIESLGDKASFCRCWKSNKFPYCDGSHGKHNAQTGDNVGPLCLKKS